MARRRPQAATATERSRASRLRKRRRKGEKLNREQWLFLQRYESDRKAIKRRIGKPRPATKKARSKASYIRRRIRDGKTVTPLQKAFLDRYNEEKRERRRVTRGRGASAMESAKAIRAVITGWIAPGGTDYDEAEHWYRAPRPGLPGIAIANAEWADASLPMLDSDAMGVGFIDRNDLPPQTGYRANVRLQLGFFNSSGAVVRERWVSAVAMQQDWHNIPGDLRTALDTIDRISWKPSDGEEGFGIVGVSIMVAPPWR